MSYFLDLGCWQSVFAVPAELVDRHLRLASPAYIKVILYLLRHPGEHVEKAQLASAAGLCLSDVEDALAYWQGCGLIRADGQTLTPPEYEEEPAPVMQEQPPEPIIAKPEEKAPDSPPSETPAVPKHIERIRYSYSESIEYVSESEELRNMLLILEGLLQKQLNHTEISVFVTLARWYGLPEAVVAMLVEYCCSIGKGSIAYIESTGIGWAEEEINTIDSASKKVDRLRQLRSSWLTVRRALELPDQKPTKKQEEFCDLWINKYHMDITMIQLAYDRCVDKKGKLSMSYMNGIIENWRRKDIVTVAQAEAEESGGGSSSAAAAASDGRYKPTYDKSEIESVMYDEWFGNGGDE